jgi:omega-6 fatty acid desaturase (delta-12 desaturase)
MLYQDSPQWHPLTTDDVRSQPAWRRPLTRLLHATPLRFIARGLAGWAAAWDGLDLRRHAPPARRWVLLSWAVPLLFAGLAMPAMLAGGGLERLVGWWAAPWLVFQAWQGVFAVAAHTAPHIPYIEEVRRGPGPGRAGRGGAGATSEGRARAARRTGAQHG